MTAFVDTIGTSSVDPAAETKREVLIVDDEVENRDLLSRILRADYDVVAVGSAEEGLRELEEHNFSIIVTDQRMPGMTGAQFLAEACKRAPDAVRVMVTGYSDIEAITAAINEGGVTSYLHKPYTAEKVRSALRAATHLRELTVRNSQLVRELEDTNHVLSLDLEEQTRQIQKTQARLMQADRMASLGTMAAGISHEINNPLAYVIANLQFMSDELGEIYSQTSEMSKSQGASDGAQIGSQDLLEQINEFETVLQEAQEGAERIKNIVRDLKTFARTEDDVKATALRPVIESTISMAWNEIRHRAQLVQSLEPIPPVQGNKTKLAQVFLNLLVNAAHAISEGDRDHNKIEVSTALADDGNVAITISDTGCGIPQDHLDRIFDPFFTTKPVGMGTGLGLSICHGIVTGFGGDITVDSEIGKGTTIRVLLPACAEAKIQDDPQVSRISKQPLGPRGRILIIDDEAPLARALRRNLATEHDVTVITGGQEALELIRRDQDFDVIFCDLLMPNVLGMDVFETVIKQQLGLEERFIFMTGSAFTPRARKFLEDVPNERLDKPFDMVKVRDLVRTFVERRRAS